MLSISLASGRWFLLCLLLLTMAACYARRDYEEAVSQNTPEAYQAFLQKHPKNKPYASQAEYQLERLAFESACKQDTYNAYADFVSEFPFSQASIFAERRAEEILAKQEGIALYYDVPKDYHAVVNNRDLPYRLLVRSFEPGGEPAEHLEKKWYVALDRNGLLIPMDPQKTYSVSPDLTFYIRESVIYLCKNPMALVEAEVWAQGKKIKTYRFAGDGNEKFLFYEIFKDKELYDDLFHIPEQKETAVARRFDRIRERLPRTDSLTLEFELHQNSSDWDHQMKHELL